ncbi:MAG: hypothetical protein JXB29_02555 [Sedimentisphaerales bacterium]|nr:hypothetical protein [Sedimentisphaerales bacterium]
MADLPRLTVSERISGKIATIQHWWCCERFARLLFAAHDKLVALNPEVMPDTVRVRTWTRLGLSIEFAVRMIDADEKMVTRGLEPSKDMGYWHDGRRCWLYFEKHHEYYIIEPRTRAKK